MGKIRAVAMGDEEAEKEQKRRAEARRQTKESKKPFGKAQGKAHVEGVGMRGGQRVSVVEGTDIKPEFKKLIEEVEEGSASVKATAGEAKKKKQKKARVRGKKYVEKLSLVDKSKFYPVSEAVGLVKRTSFTKFDGTIELHINLNPQTLGDKKDLRGSVTLPHGTGKEVKVAIADEALVEDVAAGKINFDILVAHPSMMPKLAKIARILGPKGLMPNPKNGTVTPDPKKRVDELSHGQVNFKTEPDQPLIHMIVGKVSFDDKKLTENIDAVLKAVGTGKIAKATLAATMGPGIKIKLQ
jgi:large subunit ribosomal protein L1